MSVHSNGESMAQPTTIQKSSIAVEQLVNLFPEKHYSVDMSKKSFFMWAGLYVMELVSLIYYGEKSSEQADTAEQVDEERH